MAPERLYETLVGLDQSEPAQPTPTFPPGLADEGDGGPACGAATPTEDAARE